MAYREDQYPVPSKEGFYWARTFRTGGTFMMIVHVAGKAPFLKVKQYLNTSMTEVNNWDIIWGPRIEEPKESELANEVQS